MIKRIIKFKLPIKIVILLSFVMQILFVSIIIAYLSYTNSVEAINNIANSLKQEINKRIETELNAYFRSPVLINKNNSNYLKNRLLDYTNQDQLINHFTDQVKTLVNVNSIYFGNIDGGIANAGREDYGDSLYHILTPDFKKGTFEKYRIDENNNRIRLISKVPNFDSSSRMWFNGAVEKNEIFWSDIYVLFTGHDIAISCSYPVYCMQNQLLGVVSSDLFLSHISNFLKTLEIGKTGQSIIIEKSGHIVASSSDVHLFDRDESSGRYIRHSLINSESGLLNKVAEIIQLNKLDNLKKNELIEVGFEYNNQNQFMMISSYNPYDGLDWFIITLIPESDFLSEIEKNNLITLFFIVFAIILSLIFAIILSNNIAQPVKRLYNSTKLMMSGKWVKADTDTWLTEINELAEEFNLMSDELQTSFLNLTNEIKIKEEIQKILASEKELLSTTLKSIGDGVITTDTSGHIIAMNTVAEKLTGYSNEEAKQQPIEKVFEIKADNLFVENPIYKVIKSGKIEELSDNVILLSKDKREMLISDSAAPIKDSQGNLVGVILVFRDVTEKQKLIQTLHNSQKLESIGMLAGGIAHDFNNLLAGIYGFIELANMQSDNDKITYFLSQASSSINRAKSLTQQLITFSEGGNPIKETMEISEYLKETVNFALSGSNLNVNYYFQKDLYVLDIDKGQITQVIDSIILNSIQAMPYGGAIDVFAENYQVTEEQISNMAPGEYLRLRFKDYGIGIPKDVLKNVFDPFFTTKLKRHGLGLSTSYSIIKKHNGYIMAESEQNAYTIITIYLPASESKTVYKEESVMVYQIGDGKIIIMDDEEVVRDTYKYMLEALGYEVICTKDGYEVLDIFKSLRAKNERIDAIILDLTIPGSLGGKDTIIELRKLDNEIPVFVASGYSGDSVVVNPKQYGFTANLTKPFEMKQLSNLIHKYLIKN